MPSVVKKEVVLPIVYHQNALIVRSDRKVVAIDTGPGTELTNVGNVVTCAFQEVLKTK